MQIRITIKPVYDCILLNSYRSSIHGLIYHLLKISDPQYAKFLHDEGYQLPGEKRLRFKQFCFSGLHDDQLRHPRRHPEKSAYHVRQYQEYSIVFSSPKEMFIKHVLFGIFHEQQTMQQQIHIGTCRFDVTGVALLPPVDLEERTSVRVTPFHSGFVARAKPGVLPDGKRYLTLNEKEALENQLLDGLRMRVREHHQEEIPQETCQLRFCPVRETRKHIRTFPVVQHGSRHKLVATHCDLELQGPASFLNMAFSTGIGEKGTLGMGMVRMVE